MWGRKRYLVKQWGPWFRVEIQKDLTVVSIFMFSIIFSIMKCSLSSMEVSMISQISLKSCVFFVWFALFLCYSFNMFTLTHQLTPQMVLELWLKMSRRALVKNFDWRCPKESYLKISGRVKRLEYIRRLQKEF